MAEVWNKMVFKAPSIPNHPDSMKSELHSNISMLGPALPERAAKLTTKGERFESSFHHQILLTLGRVNLENISASCSVCG